VSGIYFNPEKFGLQIVDMVEFSSGAYEFDMTVVWQDVETGALFYAKDHGCSCPSPFEGLERDDLARVPRLQALIDHLEERKRDSYLYDVDRYPEEVTRIDIECGDLVMKTLKAAATLAGGRDE
jgi:hypothetical protein